MLKYFQLALSVAQGAYSEGEVPVGAVVIFENQVLAVAGNKREKTQDPLSHAELIAIREASGRLKNWRLIDCLLLSTLEPCPMCLSALLQARIGGVIFGAWDPKGGALSLGYALHQDPRMNHNFPVEFFDFPEGAVLLKKFFGELRRKKK